jgi:hypothetical protein
MGKTTYHIIACMNGTLSVVGETTDPDKTVRDIIGRVSNPAQVQIAEPVKDESVAPEPTPVCAVHELPMAWQKGRAGFFWSCHQRNPDGRWCSYRPPRLDQYEDRRPRENGLGGPNV